MGRQIQGPETGGALPRSASTGDSLAVGTAFLVLLAVSPFAFLAAIVTVAVVLRQFRRHWWEPAVVAGIVAVGVVVAESLLTGFFEFHFGGLAAAVAGSGSWGEAFLRTLPFGVPLGVAAGCVYVGASQKWAGSAEWHPIEQRRRAVEDTKRERKVTALLERPELEQACTAPPLGVSRGGDLVSWVQEPYVVVPPDQSPAMGLLGESGSGKTVTAERLVSIWARSGRKVIFADFKGTDPELAQRVIAAYKKERPEAVCALWPAQPLDMWRGTPVQVVNRLIQVQDFTEPYYKAVAQTAVRLAVLAPDVDNRGPVRDSTSFMARLDPEFLSRAYEGRREMADVAPLVRNPQALDGVRLRYSGFFSALAGRLDYGFSFEDVDLAILTVPTLAQAEDAMAVARMVLTDFGHYCLTRKPRLGEDVTFLVDEFSAVTQAAPMVIDLAERVRDVGGQVVVSAQSYEGLGRDDAERRRMRDALLPGGLIIHRLGDPDEVLKTAGTVRAVEQSWQLDELGQSGMGSAKMHHKMRVDPDEVRQARTGEAWVITKGRAVRMQVLRTRISDEVREHAERIVGLAWAQAAGDFAAGRWPEPQPWWDLKALPEPPKELEGGGLLELVEGPGPVVPPALPAGAPLPKGPDPRILLVLAALVRAGQEAKARQVANEVQGLARGHVDRLVAKRAEVIAAAEAVRHSKRRAVPARKKQAS